jgi:hypothetical protein
LGGGGVVVVVVAAVAVVVLGADSEVGFSWTVEASVVVELGFGSRSGVESFCRLDGGVLSVGADGFSGLVAWCASSSSCCCCCCCCCDDGSSGEDMMLCFSSLHNLGKSLAVFFGEAVVLARARSDIRALWRVV